MGCYGSWYGYGDYTTPGPVTYPGMNPMTAPSAPAPPGPSTPGTTTPGTTTPGTGTPPGTGAPAGVTPPRPGGTSARLIIEKPADAQLYVDDRPVKSDGARETFSTPSLDPAQSYYYMVRVEMVRDGKPVTENRRVIVRAGETVQETFREPGVATAANR
jgi:uncharacterized protein (TIGR03000 family)